MICGKVILLLRLPVQIVFLVSYVIVYEVMTALNGRSIKMSIQKTCTILLSNSSFQQKK